MQHGSNGTATRLTREDALPDGELDYHMLMQLHMRDNPLPSAQIAQSSSEQSKPEWTAVLASLKSIRKAQLEPEAECSICLEALSEKTHVATRKKACCGLRCGHIFHRECITKWLKQDLRCPNCRGEVYVAPP